MSENHRWGARGTATEARYLRRLLAVLRTETKLVRLRRSLSRKYSPDQPRAPAGQSDGGRWTSDGGSGGGRQAGPDAPISGETTEHRTILDGGEVLTLRIRSGRDEWDEHHTVITPDGDSRIFENSGETQTIRDGQTGEVLSRSTFAGDGTAPEATVRPAFLPAAPLVIAPVVAKTFEAGALLFTYLLARPGLYGNRPGRTAFRYDFEPDPAKNFPTVWVGPVDQGSLNTFCPLNPEVQAVIDEAARRLRALNPHLSEAQLGTLIHLDAGQTFKKRNYPNVRVEFSIDRKSGKKYRTVDKTLSALICMS